MESLKDLHFDDILRHRFLITGDVGTGKTALTARLLQEAMARVGPHEITLIDMAPELKTYRGTFIGGRLTDLIGYDPKLRVLLPEGKLFAPRIEGITGNEVMRLAKMNAQNITELLKKYIGATTPILFINDVSMYLQAGKASILLEAVRSAETFFANSYEGTTLLDDHDSGVSRREQAGLTVLKRTMDRVLPLNTSQTLAVG